MQISGLLHTDAAVSELIADEEDWLDQQDRERRVSEMADRVLELSEFTTEGAER